MGSGVLAGAAYPRPEAGQVAKEVWESVDTNWESEGVWSGVEATLQYAGTLVLCGSRSTIPS